MIAANVEDYRRLARRRLPRVLFDYIDGGSFAEVTLARNTADLQAITLRQRVMRDVSVLSLSTGLFGRTWRMPLALGPIGLAGMFARRGEAQASRAAASAGVPFCLSTVGICAVEEVARASPQPIWFQLYMLEDRGYLAALIARAAAAKAAVLVLTVDLPTPGIRYRDARNGLFGGLGPLDRLLRAWDGASHPRWLWDVVLRGRPNVLGNVGAAAQDARSLGEFQKWVKANFDPSATWADLDWVRARWPGPIVLKGILDPDDARTAVKAGADGIVVSNHGGRQLDGAPSTISALPGIVEAVDGRLPVLMDGGIRSGLDVLRALARGAQACLLGRAWAFALAAGGEAAVAHMLGLVESELRTAMMLTGCTSVRRAGQEALVDESNPIAGAPRGLG